MKNLKRSLLALVALSSLTGTLITLTACEKKGSSSNEILIGEFGAMTGGTATFGQSTHKGVMMAVEEANDGGGILGRKIRIITEDDQGKPEEAQTAVTKLIN